MSEDSKKPAKNSGDSMMALGALMIAVSIVFGGALGGNGNLVLGAGLVLGVLGFVVRRALRRKAAS